MHDCSTDIRFVASETLPPTKQNGIEDEEGRRVALVLARPRSGKWHQIRQHLASGTIGHAILGDSSHGRSRTNRIWKKHRKLIKERTCLHLAHVHLPPTEYTPEGINVSCPIPDDLKEMLKEMPGLVVKAMPVLNGEGVKISIN
jgi:Pseudouridylate synthases, 23S RNA-specific